MPLKYHPNPGTLLVCDYSTGFVSPEMVKRRLVVVVSPRMRGRTGLCSVVPLSTTAPTEILGYHHRVSIVPAPPHPWAADCWAKCDMISAVSFDRLEMIRRGKDLAGRRQYADLSLSPADLQAVRECVLVGLGLGSLIVRD